MSVIEFKNHNEEFDSSCPLCDVIKVDGQLYVHISKVEVFQNLLQQKENIIKEVREMLYKRDKDNYDIYTANVLCNIQSDFEEILRGEY